MKHFIRFCTTNYPNGSDCIKKVAQQNPDMQIAEEGCLGNCGQCYMESFVEWNGKFFAVDTYEELLQKCCTPEEGTKKVERFAEADNEQGLK